MFLKLLSILYPIFLKIIHFRSFKISYGRFMPGQILLNKGSYVGYGGVIIMNPKAKLVIGANTYIGEYCNFRIDNSVKIGSGCKIAQFVTIVDADYKLDGVLSYEKRIIKDVVIGNNVFIGAQSCVLKGSNVPNKEIIPCMSIVK